MRGRRLSELRGHGRRVPRVRRAVGLRPRADIVGALVAASASTRIRAHTERDSERPGAGTATAASIAATTPGAIVSSDGNSRRVTTTQCRFETAVMYRLVADPSSGPTARHG